VGAPRALAWWLGLMAPNEEVVGSIPHAGMVLTTIVHPIKVGGFLNLVVWVPQSPLGGIPIRRELRPKEGREFSSSSQAWELHAMLPHGLLMWPKHCDVSKTSQNTKKRIFFEKKTFFFFRCPYLGNSPETALRWPQFLSNDVPL
jgi:hypothetical protein